jgi:short chain dehydrogenase
MTERVPDGIAAARRPARQAVEQGQRLGVGREHVADRVEHEGGAGPDRLKQLADPRPADIAGPQPGPACAQELAEAGEHRHGCQCGTPASGVPGSVIARNSTAFRVTGTSGSHSTAAQVAAGHNLRGRNAIVTGGTAGLGAETARVLASAGATVILAGRDRPKGEAAAARLRQATRNQAAVEFSLLDLGSLASVAAFAERFLATATTIWAALAPELDGIGRHYLENCTIAQPWTEGGDPPYGYYLPYALNPGRAQRLWDLSWRLIHRHHHPKD